MQNNNPNQVENDDKRPLYARFLSSRIVIKPYAVKRAFYMMERQVIRWQMIQ